MIRMIAACYTRAEFGSYGPTEALNIADRIVRRAKSARQHPVDYLWANYGEGSPLAQKCYRQVFAAHGLGHGSLLCEIAKAGLDGRNVIQASEVQYRTQVARSEGRLVAQPKKFSPFTHTPWIGKLASVEIEYYGAELPDHPMRRTGTDGSLNSGGLEAKVTSADTRALASKLKAFVEAAGPRWDALCGLHVHVDCRDISRAQAVQVHDYLWRFKKFLKELTPASRHDNDYCKWTPDTGDRYRAINFQSFDEHKTIEWRMQGPMCRRDWRADARWAWRVAAWVHLCRTMTRQAVSLVQSGQDLPESPATREEFEALIGLELAQWCEHRRVVLSRSEGRASELVQSAMVAA